MSYFRLSSMYLSLDWDTKLGNSLNFIENIC
jgi:hypothetical protein